MENAKVAAGPKAGIMQPQEQEPDVAAYAEKHQIPYEEALAIKQKRTAKAGL